MRLNGLLILSQWRVVAHSILDRQHQRADLHVRPLMVDAVEKGFDSIVVSLDAVFDGRDLAMGIGIEVDATTDAYAINAGVRSGGGPRIRSASVFRFCTMAVRWISPRAPRVP